MIDSYLELISRVARLHRRYSTLIRAELDRAGTHDINSVQALILFNIGQRFNLGQCKIAVHEFKIYGNYLGSNLSYISQKLIETGYLCSDRAIHDRRVLNVWLSEKGRALCERLTHLHSDLLPEPASNHDLANAIWTLHQIEQHWIDQELSHAR